jgi:N-methylhydantoinase A/oxoprolinase/acetone carboxylase beta subunit
MAAQKGLPPDVFCQQIISEACNRIATELVNKVLSNEVALPDWDREPAGRALLARALSGSEDAVLDCQLTLKNPLVGIGAPVRAYLPRTSAQLRTELIIPEHAAVANAVGAVVGSVMQQKKVLIRTLDSAEETFRLYLSDGIHDIDTLEGAVAYAEKVVPGQLETLARQAGTLQVEIEMSRTDQIAPVVGGEVHLKTELIFTAVGRPSLA